MGFRVLDGVVVAVHLVFLAYVGCGGFLAWRWPRSVVAHVACAAWGLATVVFGLHCPLTFVQNWARRRAGEPALRRGFIDTYLTGVLYPERAKSLVLALVVVVAVGSWCGLLWRVRHRKASACNEYRVV